MSDRWAGFVVCALGALVTLAACSSPIETDVGDPTADGGQTVETNRADARDVPQSDATLAAGRLRVDGNRLVDDLGPVQLLGVNRSGTEYACAQGWGIFDGPVDDTAIAAMASWGINAVRVPLHEHCWIGAEQFPELDQSFSGSWYRDAIAELVNRLSEAGLIAILDLHWSGPGGEVVQDQAPMPDADHSLVFWASVATQFRSYERVVFDLFNEPHGVDWECWRDGCTYEGPDYETYEVVGMQALVDVVRQNGARQPLIVTGLQWGNDMTGWLDHRPVDELDGIVAGLHVYNFNECVDRSCWDRDYASIAKEHPIVAGEFGQDDCRRDFADRFIAWADSTGISFLGWSWNPTECDLGPALIEDWDGTPSGFGIALYERAKKGS